MLAWAEFSPLPATHGTTGSGRLSGRFRLPESPPNIAFLPVDIDVGHPQYGLRTRGTDRRERISGRELIVGPSDQMVPRRRPRITTSTEHRPHRENQMKPQDRINTRIGTLEYQAGFPTKATVETLYNEMDFQRAVFAYQYAEPLVAMNEMAVGLRAAGINEGEFAIYERFCDPNGMWLTPNNTTIYTIVVLDLAEEGPMVVDVPAGSYGAFFDLWQQTVAEIGPVGLDHGKGGKFLVLPTDSKAEAPKDYFTVKPRTTLAFAFARGIVKNGDVEGAAKSLEAFRVYPLANASNPPQTKFAPLSGKRINTISPEGFEYWERVA